MKDLKEQIKTLNFSNLYVFYGDENYLKNLYAQKISDAVLPPEARLMNLDTLDDKTYSAAALMGYCETAPFLAERRVVVIKNSGVFAAGKKDETEKTEKYFKSIPESAIVIFIEEKIDKRLTIFKSASKSGGCVEFKTPGTSDLIKWLTGIAKTNKRMISPAVCALFLQTANADMDTLISEFNKLIDYTKDSIEKEDIAAVVTKSLESKVFDLVAEIGNKNLKEALDIYNSLLFMKESPLGILALIARQFKLMISASQLREQKKSKQEIADILNLKDYVIEKIIKQSGNFSRNILRQAFKECLGTDIDIKTGKVSDKLGVELLIIKYAG
ncbi:MAG: DNA polymerase III subunit delta [Clostridiales bacterium]|jgi:DNA polymerase-3 subunit delta|nr:DNA polymerase III subunit delta [Clostridiales bacterium]